MRRMLLVLTVFFLSLPVDGNAADPILTIGGLTEKTDKSPLHLTLEEFEAIDTTTVITKTPWHKEETTFSGVSGVALMKFLGARGTEIDAIALNDYKVAIPVSDFLNSGLILATRKNGTPMSIRDKGPIFVIYPFDANPKLDNEVIYGRSIWQVKEIKFR